MQVPKDPCLDSLEMMGVAETRQEKDKETVTQRNIAETADEFKEDYIHSTSVTFIFSTLDVFGCYKNQPA